MTAWERASSLNDKKLTEWQQVLDEDHMLIYRHAAERLAKIYNDKEQYIHQNLASTQNNTRNSLWANAPDHGNHHNTGGRHTEVAINVERAG